MGGTPNLRSLGSRNVFASYGVYSKCMVRFASCYTLWGHKLLVSYKPAEL